MAYPGPLRLSEYDIPRTGEALRRALSPECDCDPYVRLVVQEQVGFRLEHRGGCACLRRHHCKPGEHLRLSAHRVAATRRWSCPDCGRWWKVTKTHYGKRGRICGCGWVLLVFDG